MPATIVETPPAGCKVDDVYGLGAMVFLGRCESPVSLVWRWDVVADEAAKTSYVANGWEPPVIPGCADPGITFAWSGDPPVAAGESMPDGRWWSVEVTFSRPWPEWGQPPVAAAMRAQWQINLARPDDSPLGIHHLDAVFRWGDSVRPSARQETDTGSESGVWPSRSRHRSARATASPRR